MSLQGLRVLALESRRSTEIAELIRKQGGEPFVAPSMREVPLAENDAIYQFADRLAAGDFDMMMLLTGVGTRQLGRVLGDRFLDGLRRGGVAGGGPNAGGALAGGGV